MTLKSSKGFCSFKEPFFPAFYQSECLAGMLGKGGHFLMVSIKDKAGRLLFMALTLIVQGSSVPLVLSFPSICCGCNNISRTWWEGEILNYSGSIQSGFTVCFSNPLWQKNNKAWEPMTHFSSLSHQESSRGPAGTRWERTSLCFPPCLGWPGLSGNLADPPSSTATFCFLEVSERNCSRNPI